VAALSPDQAQELLVHMTPSEAADVRELLEYHPETAGGIMTPEFIAVHPTLTVEQAIQVLRRLAPQVESYHYVYVTDGQGHLHGVLSLRNLVLAPSRRPVAEVMFRDVVSVPAEMDQEEVARIFNKYHYLALPVVTADNRLIGIITADDVARVVQEEVTEDISRLGASEPLDEPYLRASVFSIWRKRVGWLLILFVAEMYTGTVLRHYEETLQAQIALAFFIPLLIGTGGNSGSQTVTTLVRAMALEGLSLRHLFTVLRKELTVALMLGLVIGGVAFLRARILGVPFGVDYTVAIAASLIVCWAICVGSVLPLVLRRLGIDPAVVSAPFIATLVDGTGLLIYFTVARLLLSLP
jgi:magnesium transporter